MKKLIFLSSAITSFLAPVRALAQSPTPGIVISKPEQGYSDLGAFISNIISIVFIFALITALFMLIWGAFEWITSGGDKENVGKARGRILNALIGLAVLAIAFALFVIAGQFLGFKDFSPTNIKFAIPSPK